MATRLRCKAALALLTVINLVSCGGGGSSSPSPAVAPPPAPTIIALSPNSSKQGGAAFTLSVIGSNLISGSSVHWNASTLPTTFINSNLITAEVSAIEVAEAGPDSVTVVNPAPESGISNPLTFQVPCAVPSPAPASTQTRARLGAYYFDGWSGPLTHPHFAKMPFGPFQDRQPLSGWQDNSICAMEQQLALAHNAGIDFFVFDWYFNTQVNDPGESLNSALQIVQALPDRHGMQFAMLYVSSPPFVVGPSDWTSAVGEWVGYMTDRDYVRVNGIPVFFIINVGEMRQAFGTSTAVASALGELRSTAQARGLPGVYVVGGFGIPDGTAGQHTLSDGFSISQMDGYDAIAFYSYPFAPPATNGMLPFSTLSDAGRWTWNEARLSSPLPFIPTAMAGWDPRPWDEREPITNDLMWYSRTPQQVAGFVADAIAWAEANPQLRPEPGATAPLVLLEAWNEFGEGSHVLPTVGEGTSYMDALAAALHGP